MTCIHLHILQYIMLQIYRLFGFRASKIKIEHIYIFDGLFKEANTVHIQMEGVWWVLLLKVRVNYIFCKV